MPDLDFEELLASSGSGIGLNDAIAIACSGGPDSTALAILAARRKSDAPVYALIVDHALRDESRAEATATFRHLTGLGLTPHILTRPGPRPRANIQAAAREARYRLMRDWCRTHGVRFLATAHHLEDQAETFLIRLARGSGVDGLGAMAAAVDLGGVWLIRPALSLARDDLRAVLEGEDVPSIDDPSNSDERFTRIKIRNRANELAALGLTPRRLAETARRMQRARKALDMSADRALAHCADWSDAGFAWLHREKLARQPEEIALRVLSRLLVRVSGSVYPPRLVKLESALDAVLGERLGGGRTIAGCRIVPRRQGVLVCRELGAVEPVPLAFDGSEPVLWDGRFAISGGCPRVRGELKVAALGTEGWRHVAGTGSGLLSGDDIPPLARVSLPAVWKDSTVVAVPHLGVQGDRPIGAAFQMSVPAFSSPPDDTI